MSDQAPTPPAGLREAAKQLRALVEDHAPELADDADRLVERLATGRFHISVLGEFKRGKSTLINALLGAEVLPTGAIPLTAVPIELVHGEPRLEVAFLDGRWETLDPSRLAEYVTERDNPGNRRGVARVRRQLPAPLLASGVVLVDTPGLASLHAHNTAAAQQALESTDGAIAVLSAAAPLSAEEQRLLAALEHRSARTFFVLNRIDEVDDDGLEEVRAFVDDALHAHLDEVPRIHAVSAWRALRAEVDGGPADPGFTALRDELVDFIDTELTGAQARVARAGLRDLADRVNAAAAVEASAAALTVDELEARLARLADAESEARQGVQEDRLLLQHAVERITADVSERLRALAADEHPEARDRLPSAASEAPLTRLDAVLDEEVAALAHERVAAVREELAEHVERAWQEAANDFAERGRRRAAAVQDIAAELFDQPVRGLSIPAIATVDEEFTYQLERLPRTGEGLARAARLLLPGEVARRRAVARAHRRLAERLDQHAGRVRHDLARRLATVRDELADELLAAVDEVSAGVRAAAERARSRQATASTRLVDEQERLAEVRARTAAVREAIEAQATHGAAGARGAGTSSVDDERRAQ